MLRAPGTPMAADIQRLRLELEARNPSIIGQMQMERQLLVRQQQDYLLRQDAYNRMVYERQMCQIQRERAIQQELQALRLLEQSKRQEATVKGQEMVHNTVADTALFKGRKLRTGKFTEAEEIYGNVLMELFDIGLVDAEEGTSLLTFLSKVMHADAKRVSMSFITGKNVWKVYGGRTSQPLPQPKYQYYCQKFQTARENFRKAICKEWAGENLPRQPPRRSRLEKGSKKQSKPQSRRKFETQKDSKPKEAPPATHEAFKQQLKTPSDSKKLKDDQTQKKAKKRPVPTELQQQHEQPRRKRGRPPKQVQLHKKQRMQLRSRKRPKPQNLQGRKLAKLMATKRSCPEPKGKDSLLEQRDDVARVSGEENRQGSESVEEEDGLEDEYWVDRLVAKKAKEGFCHVSITSVSPVQNDDYDSSNDGLWV